jgi:copper transport protein
MRGDHPTVVRRCGVVVAFVGIFVLVPSVPASAHAGLVASSPADGSLLATSPRQLILKFSEPVEVATAAVNLETAAQRRIQATRPARWKDDPTALVVPVHGQLGGSYVVFWRVVGDDTHVVSGAFSFAVSAASQSAQADVAALVSARGASTRAGVKGALATMRAVTYGAMSALVGGVFFLVALWPAGAASPRARRLLWLSLGVASFATLASANLTFAAATGRGLMAAADPMLWARSTGTHFGWVAVVRVALLGLAALLLFDLEKGITARSLSWLVPAGLVGAGLVRTPGLVDHGATASAVESAAYFVHMAAIAIWVGGLVMVAAVVVPQRHFLAESATVLRGFSAVATGAVATLIGSGLVLASPLIEHWRSVAGSSYGDLLVTKLVLVGAGIALAARVRSSVAATRALRTRSLAGEIAFVIGVIAVTSVLVGQDQSLPPTPQPTSITQKGSPGANSPL